MNDNFNDQKVTTLPTIPAKRYFTLEEVSELCGVKPHILRYWEQEFTQLRPAKKRNNNRRYYQHHEVLLVRRIRELLYEQEFSISDARSKLNFYGDNEATQEKLNFPQIDINTFIIRNEILEILALLK